MNPSATIQAQQAQIPALQSAVHNKVIPAHLEKNILAALAFYPELAQTAIRFVIKQNIKGSVMQAQPVFYTLLLPRKNRRYQINISESFPLVGARMPITEIPDQVMIGWIGHELGHILDYENRTNRGLMTFGYRYLLQPGFVKEAERTADTLAVARGLGHHIIATKRFILDNASIPQSYKDKISRLYLSPDVILEQVQQLEAKALKNNLPQSQ